ncbi:hypothetical protein FRC12_020151 [Ceratobasidium sp. 428]|nr:hypothetical protein FRC12_020151 [Ceratobasidium sp. 428]
MEVAKYFVVASRTLLFYDIITNIDDEIRYIWSKPWSLVRFIYHVNRLWPVVLLGATTPAFFVPSPSAQVDLSTSLDPMTLTALSKICKAIVVAGSYGTALAIVCPGFVMTLRVWALYERQKMVLFWLLLGQTCLALPALIEIKLQADHNMYLGNPAPGVLTGCVVRLTSFAWVPYVFALVHESAIFGLTIWKTWRLNREFGSMALTTQLTLDGSLYYIGLLLLLLFCCWGVTFEVLKIGTSASGFVVAMNSIMCNRMIVSLHIFTEKIKEKDLKISIRTYHIV